MKISNPFYSFYAIFFALAMLNAPPPTTMADASKTGSTQARHGYQP